MKTQTLTGEWRFRQAGSSDWLPAQVPGGVHTDLLAAGSIPDPFVADNEKQVQWVAESDWHYQTSFVPDAGLMAQEQVNLVCDGLDTLAEVSINGELLGKTNNMFRQYCWDVKGLLAEGENALSIFFPSPVQYVTARQAKRPMRGVTQAIDGAPHMRKAPCQFGWDWGPMLPPIGVWQDIRLEGHNVARLDDVHLRQHHHVFGKVTIEADLTIERWQALPLTAVLRMVDPSGEVLEAQTSVDGDQARVQLTIDQPQLWWPNGYGDQPLYQVDVLMMAEGQVEEQRAYQIGLRTVELQQEEDEWGKSFTFVVNGIPIFTKGSNWIPVDSFPTRFSDERLEHLIRSAAQSHQNMLRVWGGGLYEEERFYDLCDKYGILVWQDFIFSCAIYPLDEASFHDNVYVEIEENIKRIRHRASLALWCGNNEMEWGWESWGWAKHDFEDQLPVLVKQFPALRFLLDMVGRYKPLSDWKALKEAYHQFFHSTLPTWVEGFDPDTPYWPSSPSSDTPFHDVNGPDQGDAHYWDVWHGRKPFTAYREVFPRFMSEFGFQSLPTLKTISAYADETDWNMTSYIMEHHQRGNHGNGLIIGQMTETFRMPKDFEALVYLSMTLQAEGIRYGVEHWRRNMDRVKGTLYWQLNDTWPVASWASIDYFGRWKALHYATKRFYAPLLLSVEDAPPKMGVYLTSDLMETWDGQVRWSLETLGGEVIDSGEEAVSARPLATTPVFSLDFTDQISDENAREVVLVCELWAEDQRLALSVSTFEPNKHLSLVKPDVKVNVSQDNDQLCFALSADSLARFVELSLEGIDVVFSDNYFDIPVGRTVTVTAPMPEGWTLEEAKSTLRVRSLYDSFA